MLSNINTELDHYEFDEILIFSAFHQDRYLHMLQEKCYQWDLTAQVGRPDMLTIRLIE